MKWKEAPDTPGLILIVDDSAADLQTLNAALKDPHEILFARDGKTAVEIAAKQLPDLILLDASLPQMDGLAVCKALKVKSATRGIPVVLLTAPGEAVDEAKAIETGVVDFIARPIGADALRARIRLHLKLRRRSEQLRNLALTDGLTGIPNRRRFDEALVQEWRRCSRNGESVAVILGDLDHFHAYNDLYGHAEADDCLRAVAAAMAGLFRRPGDVFARFGGEEFVALLPGQDIEGAEAMAAKLQKAVNKLALPHGSSPTAQAVTLSFGIAAADPRRGEPAHLVQQVEEALVEAKAAGRNRIKGKRTWNADILVIEDDVPTRMLIEELLKGAGCSVRAAGSGEKGFAEARRHPPSLVLLDLGLPGQSGFKIAELFRSDPVTQQVKMVALTARRSWEDYDAAFASGVSAYIEKPVDRDKLLLVIEQVLAQKAPPPPQQPMAL